MQNTCLEKIRNRSNIDPLFSRSHGGINALNLPNKNKFLDFSVSINPYGPPPGMQLSLNLSSIKEYPDPQSNILKFWIFLIHLPKKAAFLPAEFLKLSMASR